MENCRKIAVDVLQNVFLNGAYSNIDLNVKLKNSELIDKDKALCTEIVYGTIKYKYTIDTILKNFLRGNIDEQDSFILNVLRISIYQLRYLDKVPEFAIVNEAVNLAKQYKTLLGSKLVNGVLRNYIRTEDKNYIDKEDFIHTAAFKYSFPIWMIQLLKEQYGEEICEKILEGLNHRPNVTVRVNSLKGEYEDIFNKLEEMDYKIEEGYMCPEAILIEKGSSIENNPLFNEGYITVQDESAMIVAPSMDLKDDMVVLDLCSAPGGKTTHMAEIMNNNGTIYACDIYTHKLSLVEENAKRLGISIIKTKEFNAEVLNKHLFDMADRVLLDVPCSGLGIIRKKPEIKWNKNSKDTKDLIKIQRNILNNGANYVKRGGYLLYSTCTLNKEENEKNIKWFLENHKGFSIEPIFFGKGENIIYHKEGFVTILPNKYMDGFFICKIKRQ